MTLKQLRQLDSGVDIERGRSARLRPHCARQNVNANGKHLVHVKISFHVARKSQILNFSPCPRVRLKEHRLFDEASGFSRPPAAPRTLLFHSALSSSLPFSLQLPLHDSDLKRKLLQ